MRADLPSGAILEARKWTGEIWDGSPIVEDDLILSRLLWISGLEKERSQGGDVDTHARYIYIHGTHAEELLGTPASHGCIRMANRDVINLFKRIAQGTRVLITED